MAVCHQPREAQKTWGIAAGFDWFGVEDTALEVEDDGSVRVEVQRTENNCYGALDQVKRGRSRSTAHSWQHSPDGSQCSQRAHLSGPVVEELAVGQEAPPMRRLAVRRQCRMTGRVEGREEVAPPDL